MNVEADLTAPDPKVLAPALQRGVQALRLLAEDGPLTVEEVRARLDAPRASVFRLLETLRAEGLVTREESSKTYAAAVLLVPIRSASEDRAARRRRAMKQLAEETGRTVEWYVPTADGLLLVERAEPPGAETWIVARIGFLRHWDGEVDAVAAVGHACRGGPESWPASGWAYDERADKKPLSAGEIREMLGYVGRTGAWMDLLWNANGVRRMACAVRNGGALEGVLGLAEHRAGRDRDDLRETLMRLREVAAEIEMVP